MDAGADASMKPELARVVGVQWRIGDCVAVREASAIFRAGEIHAVCGENGAGKSTLLKLVAGMAVPNEGEVFVGGTELDPHSPLEAIRRGVAMVLQHFALVPAFTALENIVLGSERVKALGILDDAAARARVETIAAALEVTIPLDTRVEDLGVGERQWIEIARALYRDAKLIILDEPTAILAKTEVAALYKVLRRLAEQGKGVVVVTHKMDEVRKYVDVVSVMRRGDLLFTRELDRGGDIGAQVDEVTAAILGAVASAREGREVQAVADAPSGVSGRTVLDLRDVAVGRGLVSATLSVRAGEVVGIAGVAANGQDELVSVIAGEAVPSRGTVVNERAVIIREDRHAEGLVLDASLRDNIVLGELGQFSRWGVLDLAALEREATARLSRSGARMELDLASRSLSGGNQQKIVVTRALARDAKLVVAAQPTRGVDLAASMDIHTELLNAAKRGAGVLVISADLDELRKLASRIVVMSRGRIVGELPSTASDDEVGRLMLGLHGDEHAHDDAPQGAPQ